MFTTKECENIIKEYPRSQKLCEIEKIKKYIFFNYRYGTSGFRGHNETLESVMVRVGLLASLRSFSQNCQAIGIMVTASHNDEIDNGVKIIDPSGEMMDHSWENLATQIANKPEKEVLNFIQSKYQQINNNNNDESKINDELNPVVFIGRDTRPHSQRFAQLVAKGASCINTKVIIRDFGEITTPQLHYIVRRANSDIGIDKITSDIYLKDVLTSYKKLISLLTKLNNNNNNKTNNNNKVLGNLIVDCANGVGGIPFKTVQQELSDIIDINLVHLPSPKFKVNDKCGAEHVHKKRNIPIGLIGKEENIKNKRLASLDGDCDRLMYYYLDGNNNNKLNVLDGDKQICLIFEFLKPFIEKCGVKLSIGVVQTGYANGASRDYIENNLGLKSIITPTGVKHLHFEAKKYDISIYYEANGHGTVLISNDAVKKLKNVIDTNNNNKNDDEQKIAIEILILIHLVSNQAIGDALADALLVEAALYGLNWNICKWDSIYSDRPSCLTKLKVKDRTVFKTTNAEQTCVEPKGIQTKINQICTKYKDSRSFVRPSGTEDCVRVYAEATTQNDANQINLLVRRAVYDIAGGVGTKP